jgi:hypothetical protein
VRLFFKFFQRGIDSSLNGCYNPNQSDESITKGHTTLGMVFRDALISFLSQYSEKERLIYDETTV